MTDTQGNKNNKQHGKLDSKPFFPLEKKTQNVIDDKNGFNALRFFSKMINIGFSLFYIGFIVSVWFYPEYYTVDIIYNLSMVLIFEFILVHSGVFMAITKNIFILLGIALVYGLFALAFNYSVLGDSPIILYVYSLTILNRILFGLSSRSDEERQQNFGYSALMVINFMFCIFLILICSKFVPYGGLTPDYLLSLNYYNSFSLGGEFPENPHIAFAFGVLYFSLPLVMPFIMKQLDKKYDQGDQIKQGTVQWREPQKKSNKSKKNNKRKK